ncbi:MAG: hypothetical protein FWD50_04805 [Betaproteobacteria bacterium]|nr:hypothetical protein [Betaproteobacteria bacterium]
MLYVVRDSNGKVCELHPAPLGQAVEALPADNPEILQFIHERWRQHELIELDRDFVRAIEDIIELLINKGIILFTDLPLRVQEKLLRRKEVRGQLHYAGYFDDNPDGDIIQI